MAAAGIRITAGDLRCLAAGHIARVPISLLTLTWDPATALPKCMATAQRAERVPGFAQAPDFFVPTELSPAVIIEAKITGDDGTARDKVARILRLAAIRDQKAAHGRAPFQLVACVDGHGFGVRRSDMKEMLVATKGKVFTLATLDRLIDHTRLQEFLPVSR